MDWALMQKTLTGWFQQNTGIPVIWGTQAAEHQQPPYAELRITAFQQIGEDENRAAFDDTATDGRDLKYTVCGQRRFRLGCKITSRDNRPGYAAQAYAEKARNSLIKRSTTAMFRGAEMAVFKAEPTIDLGTIFQDREESVAILDIHMGTVVNESSEREYTTYINTVEVTSNTLDTSGTRIKESLQWDEEVIP
jgi:hypothetical protein